MKALHHIKTALEFRIVSLECELDIYDREIEIMHKAPGQEADAAMMLVLQRNVKAALHKVLLAYYKGIRDANTVEKNLFNTHMTVLKSRECQVAIGALLGQQSSLNAKAGEEYLKYSTDANVPDDMQLRLLQTVFPYSFELEILQNQGFFELLIRDIVNYETKFHQAIICDLFKFVVNLKMEVRDLFFTPGPTLYFAVCEHLLTCFVHDKIINLNYTLEDDLAVNQRCQFIVSMDAKTFGLKEELVKLVSDEYEKLKDAEKRDFSGFKDIVDEYLCENRIRVDITEEMAPLEHVVLELKRMSFQVSPSAALSVLANANVWLTKALTVNGEVVGADELLQFLVYALSMASVNHLPAFISFVDKYYDEGLHETKFSYLANHLSVALDFIRHTMLPVREYILFPFHKVSKSLEQCLECHGKMRLKGFKAYAMPTYTANLENMFPVFLMYTGNENDVADCYQYSMLKPLGDIVKVPLMEFVPALHGSFFQVTDDMITKHHMIELDSGNYDDNYMNIVAISSMMKMVDVESPKLSKFEEIYELARQKFRFRGPNHVRNINNTISELQRVLMVSGDQTISSITGVMDEHTLAAMASAADISTNDLFDPDHFDVILDRLTYLQ